MHFCEIGICHISNIKLYPIWNEICKTALSSHEKCEIFGHVLLWWDGMISENHAPTFLMLIRYDEECLNLLCRFRHFSFVLRKNEKEQTNDFIYSTALNLYCKLLQKGSLYIYTHYYMVLYNVQFLQCAENSGFTGEKDCIVSFLC